MSNRALVGFSVAGLLALGAVGLGLYRDVLVGDKEEAGAAAAASGQWRQRTQLVYDPARRQMVRRQLKVWDFEPQRNLDFFFEPAAGAVLAKDAALDGRGTLIWRIRGAADYDGRAVYSRYEGGFRNGRAEGEGVYSNRDGLRYEGGFRAGLFDGAGRLSYPNGDQYSGTFKAGLPDGTGRYAAASGEIYEGGFTAGKRNGAGRLTLPDGSRRTASFVNGREETGDLPLVLSQWSGGDGWNPFKKKKGVNPDDISLSVVTDQARYRRRKQAASYLQEMFYTHRINRGEVDVMPDNKAVLSSWKGGGWMFHADDWINEMSYNIPVYLEIAIANKGSSPVSVEGIDIEFADSEADLQPFLGVGSINGEVECGSLPQQAVNPDVRFTNAGWGDALNVNMRVGFTAGKQGSARSFPYLQQVGRLPSARRTTVSVEESLRAAGANVQALRGIKTTCPTYDMVKSCGRRALRTLPLGKLRSAAYIGHQAILTNVEGEMSYSWKDAKGAIRPGKAKFHVPIVLAKIEIENPAECGAGGPEDPRAGIPIFNLPVNRSNYSIRYPLRRALKVKRGRPLRLAFGLKAPQSSEHSFRVSLRLAGGDKKQSLPVKLVYMKPRPIKYEYEQ